MVSGTLIYFATNIFNAAIPFAILPILTRYLTLIEYGQVAIFQTFLGALGALIGLNVSGAASRKYYDSNIDTKGMQSFISSCFVILIISTILVSINVYIFRESISNWLALPNKWVAAAVIFSFMSVVINIRLTQWQIRREAYKYGILQVFQSISNMGLSLLLIVIFLRGAEGRIIGQTITALIFFVISIVLLRREKLFSLTTFNISNIKEALRFGIPLVPHVAGVFLLTSADRFVINSELGIEKTGVYMVAVQISLGIGLLFDSINKAYVPWLFEKLNQNNYQEKLKIIRSTYFWFACIIIGTSLSFLYGPWIVITIAGNNYSEAGNIIGWIFLAQGFNGMYLMVTNYIFYSKKTGLLSLSTIFSGILNIALLIFLVKQFGLTGAAISFCLSMLIRFLLTWYIAQKQHPMPWLGKPLKGRNS